jgi:hypothetical protein
VICLGPGLHHGRFFIDQSVQLRGEGEAVLDAGGAGAVLHVAADDIDVSITNLTIQRGRAEWGAGLRVDAEARVRATGLRVGPGTAPQGGDGVGVSRGRLDWQGGSLRGELAVQGLGTVRCEGLPLPQVSLRGEGRLELGPGATAARLRMRGEPRREPVLALDGGAVEALEPDPRFPGRVEGVAPRP